MHMHNIIGVTSMFQVFLIVLTKLWGSPEESFVVFGRKTNVIPDTATTPNTPKTTFLLVNSLMYSFPSKAKNTYMLQNICLKCNIAELYYT